MRDVLVLCYHGVSPTWHAPLSVTPDALRAQLHLLAARGFTGATFSDAVAARDGRLVAVTFDDGMRSVHTLAAPILAELGWPGTLYVPTDLIDRPEPMSWPGVDHYAAGSDRDELLPLSWDEARELQAAGWEIASHTCTHPHLTELGDAALAEELARSKAACEEQLGRPCRSIAYPYGDVDERVAAAAGAAGYTAGAALPDRWHRPELLRWPRVYVDHTDSLARFGRRTRRSWRALDRTPLMPVLVRLRARA